MSNDRLPTRRDVLSGAIGLAAGGLYPHNLHGLENDAPRSAQASNQPYRYAGMRWWVDDFDFEGINPGRRDELGPPGFERYHSLVYMRAHQKREPDPPRLLNTPSMNELTRDNPALQQSLEMVNRWAQDMIAWAKAVREDLLTLEGAIGQEGGDPGDPPPVPWK